MSILLPHFLNEGRGTLDVYFSRVYNPIWTNPADGFSWMEAPSPTRQGMLRTPLTPTWSETAGFKDYVLPMGVGTERHDVASFETHNGRWIGFRQPVMRCLPRSGERADRRPAPTSSTSGEVWEENGARIDLSWRIDPDGSRGIRQWFESDEVPGTPITVDEYYGTSVRELGTGSG
ncbi:MAG: hypothetical protein R2695_10395 [Acidimicrobiales bacterium]